MTTFARLVRGIALDCRVQASATELAACFHPDWLAANPFTVVPDGTLHGAKDNGNGTFTNPVPPPVPVTPVIMTDKQFRKYAAQKLGGAAAVGLIDIAAEASANGDVRFAYRAWTKAQTFEKDEVESLTAVLVAGNCMTNAQRNAIIGTNWPQAT